MATFSAEYPIKVEVGYQIEDTISDGRMYPIHVLAVKFQGIDVHGALAWWQILDLQREVFTSLTDEQKGKWLGFIGPYRGK